MSFNAFDSIEILQTEFSKTSKVFSDESSVYEAVSQSDLITTLKNFENAIRTHSLISSNEEFEDIQTENLCFLNLPYFLATAYLNCHSGNRIANLIESERYFLIFLEILIHFGIIPENVEKIFEGYSKNKKYDIQREEKIQLFKDEKMAKEKIELMINKLETREVEKFTLLKNAFKGVNSLLMIPQEIELMRFRDKLETDVEAKKDYERQRAKPTGSLNFWKIENGQKTEIQTIQTSNIKTKGVLQNDGFSHDQNLGLPKVQSTNVNEVLGQKELILDRLNQPCFAQPKMTLDQHDQMEYDLMMAKQKRNEKAFSEKEAVKKQFGIEDSSDSENEMVSDAKTYKARHWDNWKDENEKGSGNRNGK